MTSRKLVALTFASLFLFLALCGCAVATADAETANHEEDTLLVSSDTYGFEEVFSTRDDDIAYIYYRCRTTNAMYVWRQHEEGIGRYGDSFGGFTAMLDPATNGPLTYDNWLAYLEAKNAETQDR